MTVRFDAIARRLAPALLLLWVGVPGVGLAQDEARRTTLRLNRLMPGLSRRPTFFDAGNYNAAEIELKNLLRDDPGLVDARLLLAQLYLRTQKGANAEKELLRAKALGADAQRWRFELVDAYLQQGRFQSALEELEREALPADGQARGLALKGRAYLGLKQLEDAKANFAAAVEIDPSDKIAASGLVQLAMLTGDMETADKTSAGLIEQFPDDPDLLLLRAEVLRQMDDSKAAVEQFGAVLAIEPENTRALLGRATANVRLQQFDSAREDLAAVDALQPNVVIVSYLRGVMAFYERDWDTAAEHLQLVLGAQPGHAQSQLLMGIVSYARNDLQLAEEYLSSSVGAMPGQPASGQGVGGNAAEAAGTGGRGRRAGTDCRLWRCAGHGPARQRLYAGRRSGARPGVAHAGG